MKRSVLVLLGCACLLLHHCGREAAPPVAQAISFDSDGMMIIEGQRTFIIGTYYLPQAENGFRAARESGYNLVRVNEKRNELDQAQAHGLKTWISVGSIDPANMATAQPAFVERVNKLKDHAALLFWEMEEEPAWRWNSAECRVKPEDLAQSYQALKQADPHHPVYTNHAPTNLVSTLKRYNAATDIVACDIYPVIPRGIRITYALYPDGMQGDLLNTYISQVGEYTDKMRTVAGPERPVFMVLQAFSWEMLRQSTDRDTQMVKYPSYEESRFMAYQSIIHGANGVIYWGSAFTPQPSAFWTDLTRVTRELSSLQLVLAGRSVSLPLTKEYLEVGHSVDRGVEMAAKSVNGEVYLLTVNADKNPVHLRLSGLQGFASAQVLPENRRIEIQDGAITERYEPFATLIYKLEKL